MARPKRKASSPLEQIASGTDAEGQDGSRAKNRGRKRAAELALALFEPGKDNSPAKANSNRSKVPAGVVEPDVVVECVDEGSTGEEIQEAALRLALAFAAFDNGDAEFSL